MIGRALQNCNEISRRNLGAEIPEDNVQFVKDWPQNTPAFSVLVNMLVPFLLVT